MMTKDEFETLTGELAKASEAHGEEFDKWYDMASMQGVENYCRTGWLLWNWLNPNLRETNGQP